MKNFSIAIVTLLLIISCTQAEKNMQVSGTITGFKKGTIYLEKLSDSIFKPVDSIQIDGENSFSLQDNNEEVLFYQIRFDNQTIPFFGEAGTITINSKLEKLETSYTITGSSSNDLYEQYKNMQRQFNNKKLELIKSRFDQEQSENEEQVAEINLQIEKLEKRRLLYVANFAKTNNNSNVSPFVVLLDLADAHPTLLNKIYSDFTTEVQNSIYGQLLKDYLDKL